MSFADDLDAVADVINPACKSQKLIDALRLVDSEWADGFVEAFNSDAPDRPGHSVLLAAVVRFAERHNEINDTLIPDASSVGRCRTGKCRLGKRAGKHG